MLIHNAVITGSLTYNNIDISDITGSEASISVLNSFSASILSYTASNNTNISALQSATASLQTFSSSILTYTASNDTTNNTQNSRLSSLEITSGSLINASASFSTRVANNETTSSNLTIASASFSTRVANNETTGSSLVAASASFSTRVVSLESTSSVLTTASASFVVVSSSYASASGSLSSRISLIEGNYATTGSNIFTGNQTVCANITSTGTIIAQTINVQQVTSSIVYSSGSNIFGNQLNDTQQFTGSMFITGSVRATGNICTVGTVCAATVCSPAFIGGTVSGTTIYGSTVACAPVGCFATSCATSFIGGTVSGTTGTFSSTGRFTGTLFSDSRLIVGVNGSDQTYTNVFIGGALTSGADQFALLLDPQLAGTNNYGVYANARIKASTAVTNAYAVYVLNNERGAGATITNNYGVYIQNQTNGATNYALYSAGGTVYFGGNVGIGTTNPSSKLTILKTITTNPGATGNAALSLGTAGSAGEYNLINFGYDSESFQPAYLGYLTTSGAGSTNGALVFATRDVTTNTQPTERMRITSGGTVLIGTTNPDVGGSVPGIGFTQDGRVLASICHSGTICYIFMGDRRCNEGPILMMARGGFFKSTIGVLGTAGVTNDGGITFSTICGNDTITERMRITSGGNVGIGTTSPTQVLHIAASVAGNTGITVQNTNGSYSSQIRFLNSSGTEVSAMTFVPSDTGLYFYHNGGNRMIINSSGNVGIGTTSPSTTLTVKGTSIGAGLGKLSVYGGGDENTWNAIRNEAIRIGRADIDNYYYHSIWSAAGSSANENNHWLRFYISNTDGSAQTLAMTMNGYGNVGIGTTSPNNIFTIYSASSAIFTQWIQSGTGTSSTDGLRIGLDASSNGIINLNEGTALITSIDGSERMRITSTGIACFACQICSGGSIARKGFDYHTSGQWYKIPFYMQKNTSAGITTTQCLIVINNNDSFQETHFTIEYGSRLQGVSDSVTQTSLRSYGVNRFVAGTIAVYDTYLITGGSGCAINTHAPITVATVGNCMTVVKVDFSSSLGGSSFVWGEVRIWSVDSLTDKITVSNNHY